MTDKRRLKGERSKQAIVKSAISCIARQGLHDATLERVAQKAKVSKALVAFHFKSKTGMLAAVLIHQETVFENGWDAILAGNSISTSEKLLELLEYDVRFSVEHRDFISVWHAYWGEAKGSSLYRKLSRPRDERYESDVRRLLSNLTEEGTYDDINVTAVERGINAMMFGIWRDSHLTHGPNDYNNGIQAMYVYLHKLFPQHYKRKVFRKKSRQ
ncbi:MAG TPA: TetR family transcriptional regulator [Gammaproteobacteria bacterium]|jgi:AcrR family transcriptional regulator|nr:TetR family transcriptional regulator [Gammaproteobacteria bacterium]